MSGQWSGARANRTWARPGSRLRNVNGDEDRSRDLYELLKNERFWCGTCGGTHPLAEHKTCREANPFTSALRG